MRNVATHTAPEFIGDGIKPDYRTTPQHFRVGLYVLQKGEFVFANAGCCRILGYDSAEQLVGRSFWELVYAADRARVKLRRGPKDASTHPSVDSFRMLKADGSSVWVTMQGRNTTFEGKPANIGFLFDMTAIGYVQKVLKKYRARMTAVEDVIAEIDLKGNILSYNDAACNLWNVSSSEIIGKNYRSFMEIDSRQIVRDAYKKVYASGLPGATIIYEIIRNDGRRMVMEDSVTLIRDRDGNATGFRTVSRDITEKKDVERKTIEQRTRLEAIFRSVQDAIVTVDPELRIIEANTATQTICGLDPGKLVGEIFPQCIRPCSAACGDVLGQTIEHKSIIKDIRIACKLESHRHQTVNVSGSPLLDRQGNFMGAVLVIRDNSRFRDLENELRQRHTYQEIIGKSKQMQDLYLLVEDLADMETTVMITGASGTGKNCFARALHASSRRAPKPFVTLNCSVLAESLLESELFGHVKGAFTGAVQDKQGRFEAADGGTILLDEIGDVSPLIQLKLLRVLQEKEFERVGESAPRKLNVRVIACTNKDLRKMVQNGEFRQDLYYRLKVVEIVVPPLCERLEDIPLLVEHFRNKFNKSFRKAIEGVSSNVLAQFMNYDWPGNVRELEHVIEHAFVICHGHWILVGHLPKEIRRHRTPKTKAIVASDPEMEQGLHEILEALNKTFWNKSKAAHLLGVSRQTLYRKMDKYDILRKAP